MKYFFYSIVILSLFICNACKQSEVSKSDVDKSALTEEITHSFFIAGPQFTGILNEDESVQWDSGKPGARDGFVLENGNILVCWSKEVIEFNKDKEEIFRYDLSDDNQELGTAQRLKNGNTLISELGKLPRLLEVNKEGKIVIDVPLQPETDNYHMQTRMARKLENGNYLVPHLLAFAVKEYDPSGKVVNVFKTDLPELGGAEAENWPFTAIRMNNGHTFVNLTHGNKSVELNEDGDVIWKVSNEDFEIDPFQDPCGGQILSNGNVVIASYGAKEGIKLFELNKKREMLWNYSGEYNVHHFQILTTNGQALQGSPMK